jgi:predicted nucleotidyltransferase/ankyrin repeat protein
MADTNDITEIIETKLQDIEKSEHVRVLFAAESGSRAWGFSSSDSDYDVRFIYVHEPQYYLKLEKTQDVIEYQQDEVYDIVGWDLRKALRLIYDSNPSIQEWLSSDIVYRTSDAANLMMAAADDYFSSKSGVFHYLNMARHNYKDDIQNKNGTVKIKSYLYVLRAVEAAKWIIKELKQPPIKFTELVKSNLLLVEIIVQLLRKKQDSSEKQEIDRIPKLDNYFETSFAEIEAKALELTDTEINNKRGRRNRDWTFLNRIFLSCMDYKGWEIKSVNIELMNAISRSDYKAVIKCLEDGADINFIDDRGVTPLQLAFCYYEDLCPYSLGLIILKLIKCGADVSLYTDFEYPLIKTLYSYLAPFADYIAASLIEHGAKYDLPDPQGISTPLTLSVPHALGRTTKLLIEKGVNLSENTTCGKAIHFAAEPFDSTYPYTLKLLLDAGVDINDRDDDGATALMHAAGEIYPTSVEYLIARGADVNAKDKNGLTAFIYSLDGKDVNNITKYLIDAGADISSIDDILSGKYPQLGKKTQTQIEQIAELKNYVPDKNRLRTKEDIEKDMMDELADITNNIDEYAAEHMYDVPG